MELHTSDNLAAISEGRLGLHWVAQLGGVIAIGLAVNQHHGQPLVVLNDVRDTVEILGKKNKKTQTSKKLYKYVLSNAFLTSIVVAAV